MKNLHLQNLKKDVQSKFIYHSGNSKTTRLQDSSQGSIFYSKTELLTHKTGAFITSKHEILRATSTSVKSLHKFHHTFAVFFFYIYIYIYTVDSRNLEIEGTLKNTSRYPCFDISDL